MLASYFKLSANILVLEPNNSWSFFFTDKTCIYSHLFYVTLAMKTQLILRHQRRFDIVDQYKITFT